MKTLHFISGLPRAGSTLLCNLLAQNPKFHTTATSGILDIIFGVRNQWDNLIEFKTMDPTESENGKKRVLKGILSSYYENIDKPIIFDKSRGWLAYIELIESILQKKVKILVPVRDLRDILSSFEKLYRSNPTRQNNLESTDYFLWQTLEGRCELWCRPNQTIGIAYNRIKDSLQRGLSDRLHFVEFEKLTFNPKKTLEEVYDFLEEEKFNHNFDEVEQVTFENDFIHNIPDLHKIKSKVEPVPPQWPIILNEALGKKYENTKIW